MRPWSRGHTNPTATSSPPCTNATYSTYVYTNDLLGRRTSKNDEQYGYNARDELISADEVSYNYDDIGNRTTAEGKTYTANNLNQYTAIDDFTPQYDADGNQTLIKTETGIWVVVYNAENRPIRWQSSDTVITMSFDRMGRRVEMRTVKDSTETLQRFVYNNYLCIQQLRTSSNTLYHSYVWDPTEPIATRPLVFRPSTDDMAYYFHDGNKNVSALVSIFGFSSHYDYTPFGVKTSSSSIDNPYQFSSEWNDDELQQYHYHWRNYDSFMGRWISRDPIPLEANSYLFLTNMPISYVDILGLFSWDDFTKKEAAPDNSSFSAFTFVDTKLVQGKRTYKCDPIDPAGCKEKTKIVKKDNAWVDVPCGDCPTQCWRCSVQMKEVNIKASVDVSKSWVVAGNESDNLLRHEEVHYKIVKKEAEQKSLQLQNLVISAVSCGKSSAQQYALRQLEKKFDDEFTDLMKSIDKISDDYDEETEHGDHFVKQKEWEQRYL